MKDELDNSQRLVEAVTSASDAPLEPLDTESASLREAWLAFGELLAASEISPLLSGEGPGVRAVCPRRQPRRWLLPAIGALAASLLIAASTAWMLHNSIPQQALAPAPSQTAKAIPIPAATSGPQWDDSLDEQVAQLGKQVTSARENQHSTADDFALMQYRIEQFRQEVQTDSL
jgi:hypothetical protein